MGLARVLAFLALSLPAWASEAPCHGQFIAVCANLAARDAVLERTPEGTLLLNPRVLTGQLSPELTPLLSMANVNQQNFNQNIRPLFDALKQQLIQVIEASSQRPLADTPYAGIAALRLVVENRERCTRTNRSPLVASIDQERGRVSICPLMSHLVPSSLLTILAHELGHAADPCRVRQSPLNFAFSALSLCVSGQCPRNPDSDEEETYADAVASSLAQTLLERRPELVRFSSNPETRFVQFMSYRLVGCEATPIYPGALALLMNRQSAQLLSCVPGRTRFACAIP